ncbi:MAG: CBS domain-containing protein [Sphingobacteriales bacterium]|nr:CBS domain-containing protein [Sphingobacteriales bacterium]
MEKLNEILARQLPHFKNIEPDCSISDALCRMSTYNTEYLIVTDKADNFLGLITEHDVASKALFLNKSLTDTRVIDILNTKLPFADAGDTLEQCMTVMKKHHVKFLPVFSNLEFKGIVSTDDILDEAVSHRSEIFD